MNDASSLYEMPVAIERYHLGCPMWAHRPWIGEMFSRSSQAGPLLLQYSGVFNGVEGNTTFYGLPSPHSVAKWREESSEGFRFCCKLPRVVTHDTALTGGAAAAREFYERMEILGDRCGPVLLQLPATFLPSQLSDLDRFLGSQPHSHHFAVEVRNVEFFDRGPAEQALDALLERRGADRAIMDSRLLMAADSSDPQMAEMQRRKPGVPVRRTAVGPHPMVRILNANELAGSERLLSSWADVVAGWLDEGRAPYVFIHSADDFYAPRLARRFHALLSQRADVGDMPPWPADQDQVQLSLI